ncbi:MAG: hypothetical protein ACKOXF_07645 [Chitinophagaceae bacterium]
MKVAALILTFLITIWNADASFFQDSMLIKGVVRPDNKHYPFKILKNVSLSLLKNDSVILRTYSDQNGNFQLKCSKNDLKYNLQILAEARSSQPVITYDSICPYRVFKTSDKYFDKYVFLSDTLIQKDTVQLNIMMSAPLNMISNCMRFNLKGDCKSEEPCLSQNPDTMCICIVNSFHSILNYNVKPTLVLRSFYADHADSALMRAEQMADMFMNNYSIDRKSIKIEVYKTPENNGNNAHQTINCNYILATIMILGYTPEKDH